MRDAFGVEKSLSGKVWKPISAMSSAERTGIKGAHSAAKTVDPEDMQAAREVTANSIIRRLTLGREGRYKVKNRKGRVVEVAHNNGEAAFYHPLLPKRGETQRTQMGSVSVFPKESKYVKDSMRHELEHSTRRKPASAAFRMARHPEKSWGDEARAEAAQSKLDLGGPSYADIARGRSSMNLKPKYQEGIKRGGFERYRDVQDKIALSKSAPSALRNLVGTVKNPPRYASIGSYAAERKQAWATGRRLASENLSSTYKKELMRTAQARRAKSKLALAEGQTKGLLGDSKKSVSARKRRMALKASRLP